MYEVANVVRIGVMRNSATHTPLSRPQAVPMSTQQASVSAVGMPFIDMVT